jgi:hypothetical protein
MDMADDAVELFLGDLGNFAALERVVVEDVEPRSELLEGKRGFTEAFAMSGGTYLNAIAPILTTVVVGIKEIHSHHIVGIQ